MEIRKAAFELCKKIESSLTRKELADCISSLRNTTLDYISHNQYAQAFGYLMTDQQREKYADPPVSQVLEPLEEEKRKLIAGFHHQILDINNKCIEPLIAAIPNCTNKVLSPYNRFEFQYVHGNAINLDLFDKAEVDNLVKAFHFHPQIQIAINSVSVSSSSFDEETYVKSILQMEHLIRESGIQKTPKPLFDVQIYRKPEASDRTHLRHIAALASVRASLSILNQLLWSKLFNDKLPTIDENNTITLGNYYSQTGGYAIVFQNGGLMFFAEPDDIIVLKTDLFGSMETQFCRIESLVPSLVSMPGEPRHIELRTIDEHLNPYGILFDSL